MHKVWPSTRTLCQGSPFMDTEFPCMAFWRPSPVCPTASLHRHDVGHSKLGEEEQAQVSGQSNSAD